MKNDKLEVAHGADLERQRGGNWGRREFLKGASALAGSAGLLGYNMRPAAAEPPPETTTIRLLHFPAVCLAPNYLAEQFLRLEGFTQIEYVDSVVNRTDHVLDVDLWMDPAPNIIAALENKKSVVALAGIHAGCYELFARDEIKSIKDLKGRPVVVSADGSLDHIFIASMMSYIGMDPHKDVRWLFAGTSPDALRLFEQGKADAFLGFAPQPQEMRAKKIGHAILSTTLDRPWSQYFCCMLTARRDFVRSYPVATKRALRAFLKATDICAQDPKRAARFMAAKGYEPRYELALEVLESLPYRRWREANPEDTLRFYALRMHEAGIIKSTPQKLIAQGTDWRFLNELKKELKT
jgi:NitT/TauT family transport system substrate-binding protein